jgi:hypothetical protein
MNTGTIRFSVNAILTQTVEPLEGYTLEQIVDGLNDGTYFTTLSSEGKYIVSYDKQSIEIPVAKIICTQADDNNDYFDYEVEED